MKVLTDDQARSFLSAADNTRYGALYFLALTTGMRQGELLGLKWGDVDWRAPALHIQRQVQRVKGKGLVFVDPKTATSRRTVSLDLASIERLRAHRKRQELERSFAGSRWKDYDLIFPSTIGTPQDQRNLVRNFKGLLKELGLPKIRFHDLRHTAATLMLQEDIHPKHAQDRLGHSQISVTLDTYSHVLPPMQKEVAKKIESLLVPIAVEVEDERQSEDVSRPDAES
jgi:integrase